jgi:hypothetical protein
MPHRDVCDPSDCRASFTGSAARSCWRGQRRKCSPVVAIVDTDNQQAVDGENERAHSRPICVRFTGLIWRESGYKVAWIERVCQNKNLRLSRISRLADPRRTSHL